MPFKKTGLCDELVQGILATGYTAPTEIQSEAIPVVMSGQDMIGCAQTGTGKTAAFVLPILDRIVKRRESGKKRVRSLILTPTRELAIQVEKAIQGYGRFIHMRSIAIYGGAQIEKQIKFLRSGVDIIVATPGRLIDHLQRGTVDLSMVEVLVLDEADRMLDMGFIKDIHKIIGKIPVERQTLLFSATISKEVASLTKNIQRSPKMIQIGRERNPIETITQHIYPAAQEQKMDLLLYMMDRQQMYSVLIFSRTKHGADRICSKLKQNKIKAEAIHSDRTQSQRLRALEGFKSGKFQVMVATDIAARGIDVEGISHVFNYDVPAYAEDYLHRIGRTGRAEATGDAVTFVSQDEVGHIRKIERFIDRTFQDEYYDGFEYTSRFSLKGAGNGGGGAGKKQRGGSSERRQMKPRVKGQVGGSKQRSGGFGKKKRADYSKKGAVRVRSKNEAEQKPKTPGEAKPGYAASGEAKKKTSSHKSEFIRNKKSKPAGSKSKKSFKQGKFKKSREI